MSSLVGLLCVCQVALATAPATDSVRRNLDAVAAALPSAESLDRALDSLSEVSAALNARHRPRPLVLTDSIVAGSLTVHTTRFERDAFAAALPEVATAWATLFTGQAPAVRFEVRGGNWFPHRTLQARLVADSTSLATGYLGAELRLGDAAAAARRQLNEALGQLLRYQADSALARWLVVSPRVADPGDDRNALAYQWATALGPASQACRAGDGSRCAAALGLELTDDKELSTGIRVAILSHALHVGGRGAWSRLVAEPGRPLVERVAAASGTDFDDLVRAWVADLRSARREAAWDDPFRWLAGLAWIAAALGVVVAGGMRR